MWSISVAPMPSMICTPVASRNASQVAFGRCSPAETAVLRLGSSRPAVMRGSIALYAVGAVKQTVTRWASIRSASSVGVAFSTSSVEAPACSGKSRTPPSPKVKANGGVPVKTSSGDGWSTWRENVSQTASRSRWKCIVALGRPVVPEVKASIATSSLEVSTSSNVAGFGARRSSQASSPNPMVGRPSGSTASRNRWSTSAASSRAISWMVWSSPVRSSGIVVTTTAPAFSTPNQAAASHWLLGPRRSTRLPGTIPRSSTRTWATRFAAATSSSYDQVGRPG